MTPQQPLTVAHISTQRGWHGGEEQARLLIRGLKHRGHRNLVLARQGGLFSSRMNELGFPCETFSGRGRNPAALWRIRRTLANWNPDVIHFHDSHSLTAAGIACIGLPIKAKVAARRVDFPIRSSWIYRRFCHRVIAVSKAVEQVCEQGGIPQSMLSVVHDGVDPQRAESGSRQRGRHSLNLQNDQPLILSVATLTDHKGHRFLLDALPVVFNRVPNACVALAGDGDLRSELEQQARTLGIADRVRFLGYRNDIPDLLHAANLFVMPSHLEGLGSSLIDVMFARLPIVSTTAGGIPELLGPLQINGANDEPVALMVPPRDPPALAHAIITMLESTTLRAALVDRAQHRAKQLFTADHMVDSTLNVYRELMEASG